MPSGSVKFPTRPLMAATPSYSGSSQTTVSYTHLVPLRRLLELLEQEVSVEFNKILTREPFSYYEQIRIFIDGVLISNQDYEQEVGANSRVLILPPYVDG